MLITIPQKLKSLSQPLTLTREEVIELEQETKFKKKSEVIEVEDENYKQLKETEKASLLIIDSDQRSFTGRLQDTRVAGQDKEVNQDDTYFVFINTGNTFKVVPVTHWYRFAHKAHYDTMTLEEAEQRMNKRVDDKWVMHKRREKKETGEGEIDFEETFDDDDGEENIQYLDEDEKELDNAGEELEKLVKNYEKESSEIEKEVEKEVKKPLKDELNDVTIRECFTYQPISVKELLNQIKKKYAIDTKNKKFIRDFIKTNCDHKLSKETGEKLIWIKH